MTPASEREEALFQAAAQLPGSERAAFLDQHCAGEPALRQRLEALLDAYELHDSFMKVIMKPAPL